jgi:hypothetical protein
MPFQPDAKIRQSQRHFAIQLTVSHRTVDKSTKFVEACDAECSTKASEPVNVVDDVLECIEISHR